VTVTARGTGDCTEWLVVEHDDETSWVRERYLTPFDDPTPVPVAKTQTPITTTAVAQQTAGPRPSDIADPNDGDTGAAMGFAVLSFIAGAGGMWLLSVARKARRGPDDGSL